ncbi:MAG: hypothetical protein F6K31_17160 [Symploca sp. SIO2G7]|nr:hypothetical protein [Symploca sp. SIO2G7]
MCNKETLWRKANQALLGIALILSFATVAEVGPVVWFSSLHSCCLTLSQVIEELKKDEDDKKSLEEEEL